MNPEDSLFYPPPQRPGPSPRALGWLRFLVWVLPSIILPMCLAGTYYLRFIPFPGLMAGAVTLGLTIYLGHFNALLRCQALGISKEDPRAAIRSNVYTFVILQFLVIPGIWFMVAWGFCTVAQVFS